MVSIAFYHNRARIVEYPVFDFVDIQLGGHVLSGFICCLLQVYAYQEIFILIKSIEDADPEYMALPRALW